MLWVALHLPLLSLEAFAATLPEAGAAAQPLALQQQHRLTVVNAAAQAAGLRPGMRRATALALAPALVLGQADAQRDAQAVQALAHVALGFTPQVLLHDGHGGHSVWLEVQASLRLFGGLPHLLAQFHARFQGLGHAWALATAPTALGAALLARAAPVQAATTPWPAAHLASLGAGKGAVQAAAHPAAHPGIRQAHSLAELRSQLDALPVWLLGPGREHWEALQGMGLHTLGDLRALPRAGVARRFGEGLLLELDQARGDRAHPLVPLVLPPRFEAGLELHQRADHSGPLLHAAQALLLRLQAWAQARQARIARFVLRMQHEPRHREPADVPPHTELAIALAEPSNDAQHLQLLLRERLARLVLPAPTLALQLHCHEIVHTPAPNGELFASRSSAQQSFGRLLERLQARLGTAQVLALYALGSHVPERATQALPLGEPCLGPSPAALHSALLPPLQQSRRPTWLVEPPQPLPERDALPWLGGHALQLLLGPHRIETAWWEPEGPVLRDYYIARAADQSLVWVYRLRLLPLPAAAQAVAPAGAVAGAQVGVKTDVPADVPAAPSPRTPPLWFLHGRFG
jgi:protein ImuB